MNKEFLESGQKHLQGDTDREATSSEVSKLKEENSQLKCLVAELSFRNRILKKFSWYGSRVGRLTRYTQSEKIEIIKLVEKPKMN